MAGMTMHGYYQQLAQERLDREYEHCPADERPLWPPTYFPHHLPGPLTSLREEHHRPAAARAMTEVPPARAAATVPTPPSREQ